MSPTPAQPAPEVPDPDRSGSPPAPAFAPNRREAALAVAWFGAAALLPGCTATDRVIPFAGFGPVPPTPPQNPRWPDLRVETSQMIPAGQYSRWRMKPMRPRYVTVHSTANTARGAGARQHASVLRKGALRATHNSLGYLVWHFTIDDRAIYQSIPCNETGEHADYNGPGNQSSIGIEMCENRDGNLNRTIDRTARFTAWLCQSYSIPVSHVVPHYHWRQIRHSDGRDLGHKPCPGVLMDGGRPGRRWNSFVANVERYHRQLA